MFGSFLGSRGSNQGTGSSSDADTISTVTSPISSGTYDSSSEDSELESDLLGRYIPADNFKTNLACILLTAFSHYLYGIFFNANESVNSRYGYPNIGSMCFVIATSLYLIKLDLSLKRLPIEARTWKYSVYKILAVIFLTHLILQGIWQQLVNLTFELVFIGKEFFDFMYEQTKIFVFSELGANISLTTALYVTYLEGIAILAFVLYSMNAIREY